ncbi:MAG: TetR family transcriptional regulator [Burkholderiales bacterium PBB3]|nr:MAG: TetR family transcriptional regulator [Burkholderiales bacterium PBB3]
MAKAIVPESSATRDNILAVGQKLMAAKGFSAVGLNEILTSSGVPKGSFYHYFASKEAFGEALLDKYFNDYLAEMDRTFSQPGFSSAQRLTTYLTQWQENQSFLDCQGKCLAVKLGAEVADLSEAMRLSLKRGTESIVSRLADALKAGVADGSLTIEGDPQQVALNIYQLWMGASLMAKIVRNYQPFEAAMEKTRQTLHLLR